MAFCSKLFVRYVPRRGEIGGRERIRMIASAENGEFIPIPSVGETIDCENVGGLMVGQTSRYEVLFRYFTYFPDCTVLLLITDAEYSLDQMTESRGRKPKRNRPAP